MTLMKTLNEVHNELVEMGRETGRRDAEVLENINKMLHPVAMTDREYKQLLEAIRDYGREVSSTPEKARAHLRSIGVLDKNGNITPFYRREEPKQTSRNGHKQAAHTLDTLHNYKEEKLSEHPKLSSALSGQLNDFPID